VLSYGEAMSEAEKMGTDLIVVSRKAVPPVFKLGEAAKALFEQRKKEKEIKKRQLEARRAQAIKEVPPPPPPSPQLCHVRLSSRRV
jgi:translation initiation factor IF-3